MNERIRELAEQAGIGFWGNRLIIFDFSADSEQVIQKFAELIVRECIKESWEEIVADEDNDREQDPLIREYLKGNNQGIVDAVVRFRNHFGVEE